MQWGKNPKSESMGVIWTSMFRLQCKMGYLQTNVKNILFPENDVKTLLLYLPLPVVLLSLNIYNSKAIWDINNQLSYSNNLVVWASFGFGFMQKSQLVLNGTFLPGMFMGWVGMLFLFLGRLAFGPTLYLRI